MERLEEDINDPKSTLWRESGDRVLRIIDQNDRAAQRAPEISASSSAAGGSREELLALYRILTQGGE
jgi:hypothetical protein